MEVWSYNSLQLFKLQNTNPAPSSSVVPPLTNENVQKKSEINTDFKGNCKMIKGKGLKRNKAKESAVESEWMNYE